MLELFCCRAIEILETFSQPWDFEWLATIISSYNFEKIGLISMLMNTLTYNISHFSSVEIAILGILIALLNLRAFSLTAKTGLLYQLRDKLMIGLIPILLIGGLIMTNQLILAIAAN